MKGFNEAAAAERPADLGKLLDARSIAVIGASDQPGNLGGRAIRYMQKFKYTGTIWPVNPRRSEVAGLPCFPDLAALPGTPDLAILSVPAKAAIQLVRDCAAARIGYGVIFAGGFGEGGAEGEALQNGLAEACRDTGFRLCGPNTIGIINTRTPMIASFGANLGRLTELVAGDIAVISQSGGTAVTAHTIAQKAGFGFRYLISAGNEVALSVADYLAVVVDDPHTKVLALYMEGGRDGDKIVAALAAARAKGKPVVMLKSGATAASARAAAAHTGALAGEHRVWQSILDEYGAITVTSAREWLETALFLSGADIATLPRGRGVAVVTLGGEDGAVAADLCVRAGLAVPPLASATRDRLRALDLRTLADGNPVDFTHDVYASGLFAPFGAALDAIAADPAVDTILINDVFNDTHARPGFAQAARDMAATLGAFRQRTRKTIVLCWTPGDEAAIKGLARDGIFSFDQPDRAVATLAKLVGHGGVRRNSGAARPATFDWSAFVAHPIAGQVVSEHDCHRILAAAGLKVAAGRLATSVDDAVEAGRSVGYPVAMKGISPAVTHRAAAGLLALHVAGDGQVRDVYGRLADRAAALGVALDGVYLQHMESGRLEVLVSALRDPVFGIMVTCGAGGVLTETIHDVVLRKAPFDAPAARDMLAQARIVQRADRIEPGADVDRLADFVARFSQLAASVPWRRFVLEVNPVKWRADDVVAVDGLLVIEEP